MIFIIFSSDKCSLIVCHWCVDFGTWVMLTELNLASNQLTVLPEEIQELTRLEVLVLSQNSIRVGL